MSNNVIEFKRKPRALEPSQRERLDATRSATDRTLDLLRPAIVADRGENTADLRAAQARLLEVALILERIEMQEDDLNGR